MRKKTELIIEKLGWNIMSDILKMGLAASKHAVSKPNLVLIVFALSASGIEADDFSQCVQ